MAVPKRKTTRARRDARRTAKEKIVLASLSVCPQCKQPKLPHRVCPNCGTYKGRTIIETE